MKVLAYASAALSLPPREAVRRATRLVIREARTARQRHLDRRHPTYLSLPDSAVLPLEQYVAPVPVELLRAHAQQISELARLYTAHRFDLLGSGWVQVKCGMLCRGVEGHVYTAEPGTSRDAVNDANIGSSNAVLDLIDPAY